MSSLVFLSRILISRQVNTRSISLRKFLQTHNNNENVKETVSFNYVYNYDTLDPSEVIDVDTSIRYIESDAFKETYGDKPVWVMYRRNLAGKLFRDTRDTCIRLNKLTNSSPCPICRDKYLVPHYKNVKLLKHFISPDYGGLLPTKLTGVCQRQQKHLKVAFMKAKDYGLISFDVPVRSYDYKYYERLSRKQV